MRLVDLIKILPEVDDELTIFLEDINDYNSELLLVHCEEEGGSILKISEGKSFHYLLEIFLAKEFVEDWTNSSTHAPTADEIAKRLYEYGINDA